MTEKEIEARLFSMKDETYAAFQAKLMPTVDPARIIGVRTPLLRQFAKELYKAGDNAAFLAALPHRYYEENNLHGFLLCEGKDYVETVRAVDAFLPFVDNWATCDSLSPKVFRKHRTELKADIDRWMASDKVYTVRFGIEMAMSHFLDEDFDPSFLEKAAALRFDEYYVKMMVAWYVATALAKQWDATLPLLTAGKLDDWTHNKSIQKAVESYRITDEQKAYLRTLKRKGKTP